MMRFAGAGRPDGASKAAIELMSATWAQELSAFGRHRSSFLSARAARSTAGLFPGWRTRRSRHSLRLSRAQRHERTARVAAFGCRRMVSAAADLTRAWGWTASSKPPPLVRRLPYPEEPHLY